MDTRQPIGAFWILVAEIVAVPLALAPSLQFFDTTPKLLVLLAGACLVWLALAAENCLPTFGGSSARVFLLLGALALLSVLATVFSRDPVLSIVGSEWRRMGLPAWLACLASAAAVPVVVGEDAGRRRIFLAAMVFAAVAAALYAFVQYFGGDPWINPALYRVGEVVRPPATLGHANYAAVFLLLGALAACGLALSATTRNARLAWSAVAALLALALVVSGSRGAWLGAAGGAVVLWTCLGRRRTLLLGFLAVTLLAALFLASPAGRQARGRSQAFLQDPGGIARLLIWRDSLPLILAHPLLGTGPDTYELSFPAFESIPLAQQVPDHYVESPHNIFLDYLTTIGIPGALLFALLMAMALGRLAARRGGRENPLDAALLAALIGGLLSAQFIADTIPTRLALLVAAALAFSTPAERSTPAARLSVALTAAAALAVVLVFGGRLVEADGQVLEAGRAVSRGELDEALRAGTAARRAFPWTGTHAFVFSRALGSWIGSNPRIPLAERTRLLAAAEDAARASLLHSSQPQTVYVHLASLEFLEGKQKEAQAALEAAIRAAPVWYRPRWLLAVLLANSGRSREAAEQAEGALERGGRSHPEIAAHLQEIRRLGLRRKAPLPGQFEFPELVSGESFNWCGGRIVLPPELELKRSSKPLLSPSPGSWDSKEVAYPRLVEREGRMLLFYSGFDGAVWRTGVAFSRDGASWQENPRAVLEPSASGWDSEFISARGSVLVDKGAFFYWYQGGRVPRIGLASSVDGLNWNKQPGPVLEPGPPGSWDSSGVADPYLVKCGETLLLYYVGQDSGLTPRLGVASSRDGVHWAKYPRNPILDLGKPGTFDERGLGAPAALPVSRGMALFYTGRDAQGLRRIGMSLSADGVTWRKIGVVLDPARSGWDSRAVAAPYVSVSGSRLLLWYSGLGAVGGGEGLEGHIGLATGRVEQGAPLFFEHATLEPATRRPDTPTGGWAFPYQGNTVVTLPGSSLTFVVEVPEHGRLRAVLQMPLPGADPARAVVRGNQQELFSRLLEGSKEVNLNLDLSAFAGQRIRLQLAALPGPRGQRASWIGWRNPRVVVP